MVGRETKKMKGIPTTEARRIMGAGNGGWGGGGERQGRMHGAGGVRRLEDLNHRP